jgi:hypothetical protein
MANLSAAAARIFRIVHVDNVPWILKNGLHCRNSRDQDPGYVNIGNPDLIGMRALREVPVAPGGMLADYVPFYFTPFSIMMYNIKTGHGGIRQWPNRDIVIFASSVHRLAELGIPFVFTDRHAYTALARFYNRPDELEHVDWELLQLRDFRHDPDDPGKKERYQAEALVHRHVPLNALLGVGCYDEAAKAKLEKQIGEAGIRLAVKVTRSWYF